MGAQPTKVQSSLNVLRGTPVEVWSKSEGRWIEAVIGAPKDVREAPPETSAVLVLFKETVGGRTDAYKWVKSDDIPNFIRARPEAKRQAGMMDSMMGSMNNTMFENRSSYEKRGAANVAAQPQHHGAAHIAVQPQQQVEPSPMASLGPMGSIMASLGPMGSIAVERPLEPQHPSSNITAASARQPEPQGVMSSIMASVGMGNAMPSSAMQSMAPSMASTIDQNNSIFDRRPGMGMTSQEPPGFMASIMGTGTAAQHYDPNVHRMPAHMEAPQEQHQPIGVMQSIMGMGGSLPASLMGSNNGSMSSMTSMVAISENKSPNTPLGSMNGKGHAAAQNPMSSFMSSMGFAVEPESKAGMIPATQPPRVRM